MTDFHYDPAIDIAGWRLAVICQINIIEHSSDGRLSIFGHKSPVAVTLGHKGKRFMAMLSQEINMDALNDFIDCHTD